LSVGRAGSIHAQASRYRAHSQPRTLAGGATDDMTPASDDLRAHRFGGDWTTAKLEVLAGYLKSYTSALKDKPTSSSPFCKAYIDAFAGTGYRDPARSNDEALGPFLPDLLESDPQDLLDGSARIALRVEPRFDKYIFIERSACRCAGLDALKTEFPDKACDISIRHGDANSEIRDICDKNWSRHRAVLFLDPYGMQVEWATIEAIAATRAIDLWLLFPLGIGVNRLLTKSGDIPDPWRARLNQLLGTDDWYDAFYSTSSTRDLFGDEHTRVAKASMDAISRYFTKRLESVFAGVSPLPGVLRNSRNSPLYLLCFAVGNERGKNVALRIANHLLREVQ
jgi:three-Cys-motif partner protein